MNKKIMKQAGLGESVKQVEAGNCPFCHTVIDWGQFRNEISKREFRISGLCQKCQDEMFGRD